MKHEKMSKMENPKMLIDKLEYEDRRCISIFLYEDWICPCPACMWGIRLEKSEKKEAELAKAFSCKYSMSIVVSDASLSMVDVPVHQEDKKEEL